MEPVLVLHPLTPETAAWVAPAVAISTDAIARWLGASSAPQTPDQWAAFVAEWDRGRAEGTGFAFVAADEAEAVGVGFVNHVNRRHGFANVGYWVRSDAVGRGYATALARALAAFGFGTLGLNRLELVIEPTNLASQRVAEKVGARREGVLRNRLCVDGRLEEGVMYGLIPSDLTPRSRPAAIGPDP